MYADVPDLSSLGHLGPPAKVHLSHWWHVSRRYVDFAWLILGGIFDSEPGDSVSLSEWYGFSRPDVARRFSIAVSGSCSR